MNQPCCASCEERYQFPEISKTTQIVCANKNCPCHSAKEGWESRFDEKFVRSDGLMDKYTWDEDDHEALGPDSTANQIKKFIADLLALTKKEAVNEWIAKNKPITNFKCSEHEDPILSCLKCHQEDVAATKKETVEECAKVVEAERDKYRRKAAGSLEMDGEEEAWALNELAAKLRELTK